MRASFHSIPVLQTALMLLGGACQRHSSLQRTQMLQHLNPQLKELLKREDFVAAKPYLLGEDFGSVAKAKLEAAAALGD